MFQYIHNADNDIFHEQFYFEIQGSVNEILFKKACEFVANSNEMLRTIFRWEKLIKPVQAILKHSDLDYKYIDHGQFDEEKINSLFNAILKDDSESKFQIDKNSSL